MIGTSQLINAFGPPVCFTDTTDIFKDRSGVALYGLDYDASDAGGASGKFGEGAIFNGSSSKIVTTLNPNGFSQIAISCWIKTTSTGANNHIVSANDGTNWCFLSMASGIVTFGASNGGSSIFSATHTGAINDGNWHHVVGNYNGTNATLYIDSTGYTPVSATASLSVNTAFGIGYRNTASPSGTYYDGSIDQVRIFNTALTSSQVTQLYQENNSTVGTHLFGCIANYNLNGSAKESMGTTAYDGTETDITYRYDGTPTAVDFGAGGKSNYGVRFNGSGSNVETTLANSNFTSNYSISFWVNLDNANAFQNFVGNYKQSPYGGFTFMSRDVGGGVYRFGFIWWYPTGALYNYVDNNDVVATSGQWAHLVVTKSSSALPILYVNGTANSLNYRNAVIDHATTTENFKIGNTLNTNYSAGLIDQVRIFNKGLSTSEVSKLYGNGAGEIACEYTATTTNIDYPVTNLAYYKLDNDSKDSAKSSGKFNQSAIFNGISSVITLPSIPGLPTNSNNTNNFTFSCWVRSNTTRLNNGGGSNPIFQNNVGSYQFISFGGNDNGNFPTGKFSYYTYGGTGYHNNWIITPSTYDDDQWHHLVVTDKYNSVGDNRTRTLYVDGTQIVQDTVDKQFLNSSATNLLIGDSSGSGNRHLDADLDQIRIYDTALDSTDVSNLYAETASSANTLSFPSGQTAIATYKLDGNSTDLSGNYSGTDTDVAYAFNGTESNIEHRFGRFGQAAVFNGTNSSISTPITSTIIGTSFTISCWVNVDAASDNYHVPIGNYTSSGGWFLSMNNSMKFGFYNLNGGTATSFTSTASYEYGRWYHFCVVFTNNSDLKVFINGDKETNSQSVAAGTNSNGVQIGVIGTYSSSTNTEFDGKIDQVRIFSSALSDSQVTQLYNEKPETDTSNFKAVLYEGTAATQYISNVGMDLETSGGLVWIKSRTNTNGHRLYDSVRGATKALGSEGTYAEYTESGLTSFEKNGFFVGSHTGVNQNSQDFVAWNWKGGGDAVNIGVNSITGSTPSIASDVSANTAAGFSIVKVNNHNNTQTIGHGLSQAPEVIFQKTLNSSSYGWYVYHKDAGNDKYLQLDTSAAAVSDSFWGYTTPTDTVFTHTFSSASFNMIFYCWHSVAGYSKIGSYQGDGTNDYSKRITGLGFDPSFVMVKNVNSSGSNWEMIDTRRGDEKNLYANEPYSENANSASSYGSGKFITDGFGVARGSVSASVHWNKSGDTYLYMAFK